MDLLLEADPSSKMIKQYLDEGDLWTLTYKGELACIAVVIKNDEEICELKSIVTVSKYRLIKR